MRRTTQFNPGTVWLITDRTKPAWIAATDLLDDGHWHPTTDLIRAMQAATQPPLSPVTIGNHLRSAGRSGWIQNSRGRVRIRNRELIELALDLTTDGS